MNLQERTILRELRRREANLARLRRARAARHCHAVRLGFLLMILGGLLGFAALWVLF